MSQGDDVVCQFASSSRAFRTLGGSGALLASHLYLFLYGSIVEFMHNKYSLLYMAAVNTVAYPQFGQEPYCA